MSTTQTKDTKDTEAGSRPITAALGQIRDSGEQVLSAARKAGNLYLDTYEKAVDSTIELELKLAAASKQGWVRSAVETQTDLARQLTSTYTSTARGLLK
jgi:hypothetical protein